MTAPYLKKPSIFAEQLKIPDVIRREYEASAALSAAELLKAPVTVKFELFRPEALPTFGGCGVLRNNSAFGCNYLDAAGRENKLGVNFDTYPGGFGLSLKFFLGGS